MPEIAGHERERQHRGDRRERRAERAAHSPTTPPRPPPRDPSHGIETQRRGQDSGASRRKPVEPVDRPLDLPGSRVAGGTFAMRPSRNGTGSSGAVATRRQERVPARPVERGPHGGQSPGEHRRERNTHGIQAQAILRRGILPGRGHVAGNRVQPSPCRQTVAGCHQRRNAASARRLAAPPTTSTSAAPTNVAIAYCTTANVPPHTSTAGQTPASPAPARHRADHPGRHDEREERKLVAGHRRDGLLVEAGDLRERDDRRAEGAEGDRRRVGDQCQARRLERRKARAHQQRGRDRHRGPESRGALQERAERERDQQGLQPVVGREPRHRPLHDVERPGLDAQPMEKHRRHDDPADRKQPEAAPCTAAASAASAGIPNTATAITIAGLAPPPPHASPTTGEGQQPEEHGEGHRRHERGEERRTERLVGVFPDHAGRIPAAPGVVATGRQCYLRALR